MANTFKNAGVAIGNTNTTLYTCPAATTTVVHAVYISNVDGTNDATVDVLVTDNSLGSDFYIMKTVDVPADSSLVIEKPINLLGQKYITISIIGFEFKLRLALTTVIFFEIWRYFPLAFLFILARLQAIPQSLYAVSYTHLRAHET
mgnify:CR=1 FL=1